MGFKQNDSRFNKSEYCPLAVAFDVGPSHERGSWWGAKVDEKLMDATIHLSKYSGGEAGMVHFIHELGNLSHENLVDVIDDSIENGPTSADTLPSDVDVKLVFQEAPPLMAFDEASMVKKVLGALDFDQLKLLKNYYKEKPFHHGWYWHGPEGSMGIKSFDERFSRPDCGCPLAIAFGVERSHEEGSWWGAKPDSKLASAVRHLSFNAGSERGMDLYIEQLSALDSPSLAKIIDDCIDDKDDPVQ